jgi:hypothetical protein
MELLLNGIPVGMQVSETATTGGSSKYIVQAQMPFMTLTICTCTALDQTSLQKQFYQEHWLHIS